MKKGIHTEPLGEKKPVNPILIIACVVLLAAVLTYVVPAGSFDRVMDETTGYENFELDSFHFVEQNPLKPFALFTSLTTGMQSASQIIFFLLIIGGTFQVVEYTQSLKLGLMNLVKVMRGRELLLIPVCIFIFGLISATAACWEEYLAILPLIYVVCLAAGFNSITAVAIVFAGAASGYAGGMTNAFTVGVAQTIAGLEMFSGFGYRCVVFAVMVVISSAFVLAYALRVPRHPELDDMREIDAGYAGSARTEEDSSMTGRQKAVLVIFAGGFAAVVLCVLVFKFYMDEMSAIFLIVAFLAAIAYRMGVNTFIEQFIQGASGMVWIGFLIGMCYSISDILGNAGILDTIIYFAGKNLAGLGPTVCAPAMFLIQDLLNMLIPSGSGQAAVTMPFMAPLADVVGVSRQTAVLAFHMGDSFTNCLTPTSPEIMAGLAICHVPYRKWLKFFLPLWGLWCLAACILLVVAVQINYH